MIEIAKFMAFQEHFEAIARQTNPFREGVSSLERIGLEILDFVPFVGPINYFNRLRTFDKKPNKTQEEKDQVWRNNFGLVAYNMVLTCGVFYTLALTGNWP